MNTKAVNYDQVAPTYNRRFDGKKRQPILIALLDLVRQIHAQIILEVGRGTGFWLAGLGESLACQVDLKLFGLDLAHGMLRQARLRSKAMRLVRGQAERYLLDMIALILSTLSMPCTALAASKNLSPNACTGRNPVAFWR